YGIDPGRDNDFITVKNNTLTGMTLGVVSVGLINNPSGGNDHWEIAGNTFSNTGILLRHTGISSIHHNTFIGGGINLDYGTSQIDINHNIIRSIHSQQPVGIMVQSYEDNSDIRIF